MLLSISVAQLGADSQRRLLDKDLLHQGSSACGVLPGVALIALVLERDWPAIPGIPHDLQGTRHNQVHRPAVSVETVRLGMQQGCLGC